MRIRLRLAAALTATVLGGAVPAVVGGTPASAAATRPTISAPTTTTGYHTVRITGTARPGATVALYESAYVFHDLKPAIDWARTGKPVTTRAAADGRYRIDRWIDTGFLLAVKVDGVLSRTALIQVRLAPVLSVTSTQPGTVTARLSATPAQPFIPVRIERRTSTGGWQVVARGWTDGPGTFTATIARQAAGRSDTYRAWVGGDRESALLAAYSAAHQITVT